MNDFVKWDPNAFNDEEDAMEQEFSQVHLRVRKRNNRKYWTTIEGLDENINVKKLIKNLKKELSCNGSIKDEIITFQGDKRQEIKDILIREEIVDEKHIVVHGF